MKKNLTSLLLAILCAFFGVTDASAFLMADASALAAAVNEGANARATAGVDNQGVHTMTDKNVGLVTDTTRLGSPDLIDDPIDQLICKMFQSGIALDQIGRHLQQVKQNGMRYSFWSVDTRPIESVTTAAVGNVANATTIALPVANINIFDKTDIIVVPSVRGYEFNSSSTSRASYLVPLVLYVQAIDSQNGTLICQAVNGKYATTGSLIPTIPQSTKVYRLGHAASEGDVQTTPYAALPEPDELFMQIFKTQVMESTISIDSEKKVNWSLADQQELALYNMRKEIELSYIYGVKGYFRDLNTKRYVYTCSGVIQQILEKGTVIPLTLSTMTENSLLTDVVKTIFLGNSGSASRYMFAGSDFVAKVGSLGNVSKQIDATQVFRKFGVDWKSIQFMSWQLNLYQHPLLDQIGLSKCAIVLDLPHVRKNVFRSLTNDVLDLIKSGVFDGKSTVWTEISSIGLKYPKCHAFIYDTTQFAPVATVETNL